MKSTIVLSLAISFLFGLHPASAEYPVSAADLERARPQGSTDAFPTLALRRDRSIPMLGLPSLPESEEIAPEPTAPGFFLKSVQIVGNTAFPEEELIGIAKPFLNRTVSASDLENLRRNLTRYYIDRGYINSGAILPDQNIDDGRILYRIIEGKITDVDIVGARWLSPSYLRDRLELGMEQPFQIHGLNERLDVLAQDPAIKGLKLDLMPSPVPGEAKLIARVNEAKPFRLTASVSNSQTPSVGETRGDLDGEVRNLLGHAEWLRLRLGRTDGVSDRGIAFGAPITSSDTTIGGRYDHSVAGIVQANLKDLGVRSETSSWQLLGISQPLLRTSRDWVSLGASVEHRTSRNYLLGEPFSFSRGTENGRASINVIRFFQQWEKRDDRYAFLVRSTASKGIPAFGATATGVRPNANFLSWLGQVHAVGQISEGWQLLFRSDLQVSRTPLFGMEQFSIGGVNSVRGYRESEVVADNGIAASLELRVRMLRFDLPGLGGLFDADDQGALYLASFADAGRGWYAETGNSQPSVSLRSAGVGTRIELADTLQGYLYYGHPFLKRSNGGAGGLQKQGVHFRLATSLSF